MENKIIISDSTLKNAKSIVKSMDLKESCETYFKLDYLTKNIKDELINNIVSLSDNGKKTILPIYFDNVSYNVLPIITQEKVEQQSVATLNIEKVKFYAEKNNLEIPMKIDVDKLVELEWFKKNRNEFYDFVLIDKITKGKKPFVRITKQK